MKIYMFVCQIYLIKFTNIQELMKDTLICT